MNEYIYKDPLYIEIMKNRCLTCYKEEQRLVPLTEERFLKMFVPEITITHRDCLCEDCDSMLKNMIRFRETVLTAQELVKTAYEQQCQDVEQKISITKHNIDHCSILSSKQYSFNSLHEEIDIKFEEESKIKEESIDIDQDSVDWEETLPVGPISEDDQESDESETTLPTYPTGSKVKEEIMEVNEVLVPVTLNASKAKLEIVVTPLKRTVGILPKVDNKPKVIDKSISENRLPKDGDTVMYGEDHACTVQILSEADMQAYREDRSKVRSYVGGTFKCGTCILSFRVQKAYDEHMKLHDLSAGNYSCNICQQRFPSNEDMEKHRNTHYIKYVCSKCDFGVASLDFGLQHYNRQHHVQKRYCKKCDAVFDTFREQQMHKYTAHGTQIKCNECGFIVRHKYRMKEHMVRHRSDEQRVECNICKKKLKVNCLKRHIKNVHEANPDGKSYCKPCDQMFKNEKQYQMHMKKSQKHNPVESFKSKCEVCGKWLGSSSSLTNHLATVHHLGTDKYPCDKCDQKFKTPRILKRHIRTKHGNVVRTRNAVCDQCGKAFHTKDTLADHMTTHTGARPHACVDCGATFGFKGALFTHRRLKHKVKRKKDIEIPSETS